MRKYFMLFIFLFFCSCISLHHFEPTTNNVVTIADSWSSCVKRQFYFDGCSNDFRKVTLVISNPMEENTTVKVRCFHDEDESFFGERLVEITANTSVKTTIYGLVKVPQFSDKIKCKLY